MSIEQNLDQDWLEDASAATWRAIYLAVSHALVPLAFVRLIVKAFRNPAYLRDWQQRTGRVPEFPASRGRFWLHAVSVGEALMATTLLDRLRRSYPAHEFVISCTTPAGKDVIESTCGPNVSVLYLPYDLPSFVSRFLRRVKPDALILMETEIWPTLIRGCQRAGVPVILANARLSERSWRGYRRLGPFVRSILADVAHVAARSEVDAQRFLALDMPAEKLTSIGNLKHIPACEQLRTARLASRAKDRGLWIAGSTHAGEDLAILEAHSRLAALDAKVQLILVPRKLVRVNTLVKRAMELGLAPIRGGRGALESASWRDGVSRVLIVDRMGELRMLYGIAQVAFVGGSLVGRGGQNPIEPVATRTAVISGPSTYNFESDYAMLANAGAVYTVESAAMLVEAVKDLLANEVERYRMTDAAANLILGKKDPGQHLVNVIRSSTASLSPARQVRIPDGV